MKKKISLNTVSITDIMEAINKNYGDITALQIKEKDGSFRKISYIELGRRTVDVSSNLIKLGIVKDDKIAIYSENRPEWPVVFFGIVCAAATVVPLDVKLSEAEVQFILSNSQAKCVFVSEKHLGVIDKIRQSLSELKYVIVMDDSQRQDVIKLKDLKLISEENKNRSIREEDTALIIYTSGTTGSAKGVELTFRNLMFQVRSLSEIIEYKTGEQFLSILPLNHTLELTGGLLAPLYAGACITYCDSLKSTRILSLMQETHTRMMVCVPLVLKMLHDGIIDKVVKMPAYKQRLFNALLSLSKKLLRFNFRLGRLLFWNVHQQFGAVLFGFVSGGAPLNVDVEINFNALGFRILQGYGLTETAPVIAVNTYEYNRFGSVGKPLPGTEVKILKENESSKDGEILTRGNHVMKGYFQSPEKTAEVIKDGWFHTGDLGYFDEDGFLYISGRIRNLIVLGAGKKVFPEEVEEVISKSPFVKEICVLGKIATKGIRQGCEEVYAVIVPNLDAFEQDERIDKPKVRNTIAKEIFRLSVNLAEYKRIMDFEVWYDELPKTSTRKVKRKVLLELVSKKDSGEGTEKKEFVESIEIIEDDLTSKLRKIISALAKIPEEKVRVNSSLYSDLAIDSLMKVEILSAIHKELDIDIPDRLSYEINTFGDLIKFCKEYKAGRSGDEIGLKGEINDFIISNTRFKLTHNLSYFIFKALFKLYFNKTVYGLENVPLGGSFIIAANHTSLLDFPLILTSLPFNKMRDIFAPAAKDYFYSKKYRKAALELLFNTFPFERMGDFMKGLKICETLVKNNRSIVLFPEGTRVMDNNLQPFKPGLGSLSLNLNVPILPIYIDGAFKALPKGKVLPLPEKIQVHFGKVIHPAHLDLSKLETNYEKYIYLSELAFNEVNKLKQGG